MARLSVNDIKNHLANLSAQRQQRQDARKKEEGLLPPDFTGYIFTRCREEAAKVREWLGEVEAECERLEELIAEGEKEARAAYAQAMIPGKTKGDVLFGFEVIPPEPDPHRFQITPEALKIRQDRVQPLQRRLNALQREARQRRQEISHLRRIAEKAAQGTPAIIHFLDQHWQNRLELGAGTVGIPAKLAAHYRAAVPTDATGHALPLEAMGEEGQGDLPPRGRVGA